MGAVRCVSYRSTCLMTFTLVTENTRKYYQAPFPIFRAGPGDEATHDFGLVAFGTDCLYSCTVTTVLKTLGPWVPGPRILGSRVDCYSLPLCTPSLPNCLLPTSQRRERMYPQTVSPHLAENSPQHTHIHTLSLHLYRWRERVNYTLFPLQYGGNFKIYPLLFFPIVIR